MKKSFPISYPYFNEHGVSFSLDEVNGYVIYLLEKFKPRSVEYGVELAYLLLWILDNAYHKRSVEGLLTVLFARIVRRGTFETTSKYRAQADIPEQVDESVLHDFEVLEYKLAFEQLVGDEYTIEDLLAEDRRKRHVIIKKLQRRIQEREQSDGC